MRRERQRAATPAATGEARSRGAVAGYEHHRGPWAGPRRSLGTPSCAASAWRREGTPRREGEIEEEEDGRSGARRRRRFAGEGAAAAGVGAAAAGVGAGERTWMGREGWAGGLLWQIFILFLKINFAECPLGRHSAKPTLPSAPHGTGQFFFILGPIFFCGLVTVFQTLF